jgi:hypothetical protein
MTRAGAGTFGIMTLGFLYSSFFSLMTLARQPGTRATIELNMSIVLHSSVAICSSTLLCAPTGSRLSSCVPWL